MAGHVASLVAAALAVGTACASTLTPPTLPLTVRNPYFSTWLGNARDVPWNKWPMFYTGQEIGFSVLASVPSSNLAYPLLGRPQDSLEARPDAGYNVSFPNYRGASYDASTTNLTYEIPSPSHSNTSEPVEIVLSFLSPITPTSTVRQSIPATYLSIYASGSFDVVLSVDLNGLWVSGDTSSEIEWQLEHFELDSNRSLKTWMVKRRSEALFTEHWDRGEWGTLAFSAPSDVHYESGNAAKIRQRFSRTGVLQNENDSNFRSIMDDEPVFAFSKTFNLGSSVHDTSSKSSESTLFTIAHIQDPVVQYASSRGLTNMRPLWKSYFLTDEAMITYHYKDFEKAKKLAADYSDRLAEDAFKSGSHNYRDIVALSARQVLGATSFSGTPDNPLIFLKEISSNGNCQTVDVIFPSFPFFLYTNPRWLAYLLEPLLEHQLSGQYPNRYSMHDLGAHFPNETGHPDGRDEYMPVEECGDMLIMGLSLVHSLQRGDGSVSDGLAAKPLCAPAKATSVVVRDRDESYFPLSVPASLSHCEHDPYIDYNDGVWRGTPGGKKLAKQWVDRTYILWKQWTKYLVDFSLEPENQLSTDDFAGWLANQTNLALKGIVGIKAMSELAGVMEYHTEQAQYANISETYIKKWEEYGMSRDGGHAKLAYHWYGSWTTLYSLFADSILCFHSTKMDANPPGTSSKIPHHPGLEVDVPTAHSGQQPLTGHRKPSKSGPSWRRTISSYIFRTTSSSNKNAKPTQSSPKDFIPHHIYTAQSHFYSLVMQRYGLPLDSRHLYTKSDWAFEVGSVASPAVRKEIIDRHAVWLNETRTDKPMTDLYDTETSEFPGVTFYARPVVGAHFAMLAMERSCWN
ncbi:DUF1793-domain-containing protein [Eremomyces bilateralis CBS 781.70]|uniref:DUF1793-domain-containing protein n=1 Tax=Eremomyces bilateralis CBS 781.70 TaxID=1392243 RepID=A0A6G1GE04_9PEZI|nr:DUF1793-domain-containing protein [Eremomyces bilateralis CBS 781.70]KAF1816327.1 DUF1793-domain-containing protein [Eremomyces bilateralis CBS 781.70]